MSDERTATLLSLCPIHSKLHALSNHLDAPLLGKLAIARHGLVSEGGNTITLNSEIAVWVDCYLREAENRLSQASALAASLNEDFKVLSDLHRASEEDE